ncbi:unnamed protein product [Rotaria socialis]|uniref:AIG1-type G domain-containing protein n=2 Tax=Rotaria socialis TaxID=392032 RepID=A0A818N2U2_9BILA|nr:unnamed protein product [Rotaria socialis]CAF3599427.1 unnamed protein product [Rotaria socialis]CAF4419401.1 unnamed protein product [Rotaria socialis]CAF4616379.1 unnamed protein product [Rotaria socialis]
MARITQTNVLATGALNEVRMILLGKTGTGKSAFGNTILGQERFHHEDAADSITIECASDIREFDGKRLFVVDTPGFLDTNQPEEVLHEEIAKSYQMTARPGPHVFLLVFDIKQRYTPEQFASVELLDKIFGPKAVDNTIIVFTHVDELKPKGKTLEQYLEKLKDGLSHPLNKLLDKFHRRYLGVNNYGSQSEKDATARILLDMVNKMMVENKGQVYTNEQFTDVAKAVETEMSKGTYQPYKSDGSFALLPQTKAIVIDGYLRRMSSRKTN